MNAKEPWGILQVQEPQKLGAGDISSSSPFS
jgi:hypothetical protein